jgi:hypothetical protein
VLCTLGHVGVICVLLVLRFRLPYGLPVTNPTIARLPCVRSM